MVYLLLAIKMLGTLNRLVGYPFHPIIECTMLLLFIITTSSTELVTIILCIHFFTTLLLL